MYRPNDGGKKVGNVFIFCYLLHTSKQASKQAHIALVSKQPSVCPTHMTIFTSPRLTHACGIRVKFRKLAHSVIDSFFSSFRKWFFLFAPRSDKRIFVWLFLRRNLGSHSRSLFNAGASASKSKQASERKNSFLSIFSILTLLYFWARVHSAESSSSLS